MLTLLRNRHNKRIREMCRVTMHQVELYGITSVELQKRICIWDLDYYVSTRINEYQGIKDARTNSLTACTPNCPKFLLNSNSN